MLPSLKGEIMQEEEKNINNVELSTADTVEMTKEETTAKKTRKKKEKPAFTDSEVQEFMEWKNSKKLKPTTSVVADALGDNKLYEMWKEESKMVTGVFRCLEPRGGSVKFAFRKYKQDPTRWYTMQDGQEYTVPLAVARHLNSNCNYPVHSHILDSDGKTTIDTTGKKESRMNFESTQFMIA